jgi:O-antigen/teichoic acid export membrane protein
VPGARLTITDETVCPARRVSEPTPRTNSWFGSAKVLPPASSLKPLAYSFTDQVFAVAGTFLVNVMLARTQTKSEYGMFTLSYSIFTFLAGLHNAAILEPYTVYGSGRYRDRFSAYLRLMSRWNVLVGLLLMGCLLCSCLLFRLFAPTIASKALVGLGLSVGVLLSGAFLRRVFYLQRQPVFAAGSSFVFFLTVACGIWLTLRMHALNGFSVFLILGLGWIAAGAGFGRKLAFGNSPDSFLNMEPGYWGEHWDYARWVFVTALIFQLTNQGYYWLVAGFLSVREVAELKVMYILVMPIDQFFIAVNYLVLPALAGHYASGRRGCYLLLWKRISLATIAATGLFAVVVRVLGRQAMHNLYAGRFDDLAPLLFTLSLLPLVMGIGNTMNDALKAAEEPRFVFYAYLCSGAATFLGGIPLVRQFGLRGAVYGLLLSATAYTCTLAVAFFSKAYASREAT